MGKIIGIDLGTTNSLVEEEFQNGTWYDEDDEDSREIDDLFHEWDNE